MMMMIIIIVIIIRKDDVSIKVLEFLSCLVKLSPKKVPRLKTFG